MVGNTLENCNLPYLSCSSIMLRVKAFKATWCSVSDMVSFGFVWDSNKKLVTAEDHVWAQFIGVNKQAAKFINKCLPHFEDLSYVWGQDHLPVMDAEIPPPPRRMKKINWS